MKRTQFILIWKTLLFFFSPRERSWLFNSGHKNCQCIIITFKFNTPIWLRGWIGCLDTSMPKSILFLFISSSIIIGISYHHLSMYLSGFQDNEILFWSKFSSKCNFYQQNKLYTFFLQNKWITRTLLLYSVAQPKP